MHIKTLTGVAAVATAAAVAFGTGIASAAPMATVTAAGSTVTAKVTDEIGVCALLEAKVANPPLSLPIDPAAWSNLGGGFTSPSGTMTITSAPLANGLHHIYVACKNSTTVDWLVKDKMINTPSLGIDLGSLTI